MWYWIKDEWERPGREFSLSSENKCRGKREKKRCTRERDRDFSTSSTDGEWPPVARENVCDDGRGKNGNEKMGDECKVAALSTKQWWRLIIYREIKEREESQNT